MLSFPQPAIDRVHTRPEQRPISRFNPVVPVWLTFAQFPAFEQLTLASRRKVASVVGRYPPYSDFNFISLHSWNLDQTTEIASLNNNLIVKARDPESGNLFLSLLGDHRIDQTIDQLLAYAAENGLDNQLHLVPEHVVERIKTPEKFSIKPDRDSFDYVVVALKFKELKGDAYGSKRHGVNKFAKQHGERAKTIRLDLNPTTIGQITSTFRTWCEHTGKTPQETEAEHKALQRLLTDADQFNLETIGVYVDNSLVAYAIYEIQGAFAIGHFEKAVKGYPGLYDQMKHQTAHHLHECGVKYINYMQDLGIEGLRKAKLLLHPDSFLKKYSISSASA